MKLNSAIYPCPYVWYDAVNDEIFLADRYDHFGLKTNGYLFGLRFNYMGVL